MFRKAAFGGEDFPTICALIMFNASHDGGNQCPQEGRFCLDFVSGKMLKMYSIFEIVGKIVLCAKTWFLSRAKRGKAF